MLGFTLSEKIQEKKVSKVLVFLTRLIFNFEFQNSCKTARSRCNFKFEFLFEWIAPSYHNAVLWSGHHLVLWVSLQTRQHWRQKIGEQQVVILSISTVGKTERKLAFSVKNNVLQDLPSWHNSELQMIFVYRTIARLKFVHIRRKPNWGRTLLLLLVNTRS